MLLVDDHHARICKRRQRGSACANDNIDFARTDPTPLVGALAVAQRAVKKRNVNVQIEAQPRAPGNGERDLRH